ncbi:hypothetical protein F5X68DRAFT_10895 [Plectosphaerella plurivora]|uniref:Uncharacterized protein n=1 Tax=Plectosphaerella plurivora TaxID=936078 RepID=A0A9P8VD84_9PEZI|nr:hypothetical protein F5X68DRAFT_10895 [Plectosphaerella plurivora]
MAPRLVFLFPLLIQHIYLRHTHPPRRYPSSLITHHTSSLQAFFSKLHSSHATTTMIGLRITSIISLLGLSMASSLATGNNGTNGGDGGYDPTNGQ